ncbi:type II toxin-antitoxin system Phd/YefM family antitoxin [Streptomyces sp. NPDC045431]|uniref:type II toxin-antitoxin system Phd/YefM family antitoxin n=1 Tax=Streptomyces sp. NPDC045431 TaxID=3155613 RepID=UPI003405ED8E
MAKIETVGVQQARDRLRDHIDAAVEDDQITVITRHGKQVAVLVPAEWYQRAQAALDAQAADES